MGKQHPARSNLEAARPAVLRALGRGTRGQQANVRGHITAGGGQTLIVLAERRSGRWTCM